MLTPVDGDVPSAWALIVAFSVLGGLGAILQAALAVVSPTAAAFLAPESAAATTGLISALTGASSLISPVLGQLADQQRSFRAPFLIANSFQALGVLGVLAGVVSRSVHLYTLSATLSAMGGNACLMLSFALAGAYGALAPARASAITSTLILATTLLQSLGLALLATYPLASASAPSELSLTSLVVLCCLSLLSPVALLCLPLAWLQPRAHAGEGSAPCETVTPTNDAGERAVGVLECARGALTVVTRYCTNREYMPLLLLTLAVSLVTGAVYFMLNFLLYFLEDWTSVGDNAVTWFSAVSGYATLLLAALVVPMGACLDALPRFRTYTAWLLVLTAVTAATPHVRSPAPLGWLFIPALMTAFQALNLLGIPMILATLPDRATLSRCDAQFHPTTHALMNLPPASRDITMSTSVQAVAMALNAFVMGRVLEQAETTEFMLGGRLRYSLEGYELAMGAAAVEILVGAVGIVVCGEIVRLRKEGSGRGRILA